MNLNQITLPASDVAACIDFYRQMGFTLVVDSAPRYARFECTDGGATFSLHHVENAQADSGYLVYFECEDLDARVSHLQSRGIAFDQLPADQPWLWREARLSDPSGNRLCLFHAGENRRYPPWRVSA